MTVKKNTKIIPPFYKECNLAFLKCQLSPDANEAFLHLMFKTFRGAVPIHNKTFNLYYFYSKPVYEIFPAKLLIFKRRKGKVLNQNISKK